MSNGAVSSVNQVLAFVQSNFRSTAVPATAYPGFETRVRKVYDPITKTHRLVSLASSDKCQCDCKCEAPGDF